LQAETKTTISIDENENGEGVVEIFSNNKEGMEEATTTSKSDRLPSYCRSRTKRIQCQG
jgi:hypothetical protein